MSERESLYQFLRRVLWRRRPGAIGPLPAPGMTDLMVTPEAIDKFLAENPPDALT